MAKMMHPEVEWWLDQRWVVDGKIWTSGGRERVCWSVSSYCCRVANVTFSFLNRERYGGDLCAASFRLKVRQGLGAGFAGL